MFDQLIERAPGELRYRGSAAEAMLAARQPGKALAFAEGGLKMSRSRTTGTRSNTSWNWRPLPANRGRSALSHFRFRVPRAACLPVPHWRTSRQWHPNTKTRRNLAVTKHWSVPRIIFPRRGIGIGHPVDFHAGSRTCLPRCLARHKDPVAGRKLIVRGRISELDNFAVANRQNDAALARARGPDQDDVAA